MTPLLTLLAPVNMQEYAPHGIGQPDITTVYFVRQNPWETGRYTLDLVHATNAIHIPFAHAKVYVDTYKQNQKGFVPPDKSRLIMELPVNTLIVIAGKQQGLVARITSEVNAGVLEPIYTIMNQERIVDYTLKHDSVKIASALEKNLTLTPFYTLYRTVEVLGTIVDVDDWRTIAQMGASGRRILHFWKKNK
jgi:hypothetical protein